MIETIKTEVWYKAVKSRGPGGQNVNKVNSAALMKWDFMLSSALNEDQKNLINEKLYNHINKEGLFYIKSDSSRDLEKNKSLCLLKLMKLLKAAFHVKKNRKSTRPTLASKKRRLQLKKQNSEIKKNRKKVEF